MPAHGWVGARATLLFLVAHFAKQNTNSVGVQSEGEAEGGCGGNSAAPEPEAKPRRPARKVEGRAEQKNYLFLLEEFFGGVRKSEIVKAIFLRGVPVHGTAAGRSGWFRSAILDKMSSSRVVKTQFIERLTRIEAKCPSSHEF